MKKFFIVAAAAVIALTACCQNGCKKECKDCKDGKCCKEQCADCKKECKSECTKECKDCLVNPNGFVMEHPAIDVADPVAVAAWWCENLGFTITKQSDDAAHTTFIVDASGRIAIEMYRAQTQPSAPDYASMDPLTLHFGFTSKDVNADIERLQKAGATLLTHDVKPGFDGAMMRDPFGIAIQFVKREKSVLLK